MRSRCLRLVTALVAVGGLLSNSLPASAQPALSHLSPGALAPGKTTEVTLHGSNLKAPLSFWTSFPAHVELLSADAKPSDGKQASVRLTLSSGVPLGIGGLVVATADGLTDVAYVMIDDMPSVAEGGANHAPAEAQEISLPTSIDGLCDGTLSDYYRIHIKRGQTVSCDVVASRLGWDLDPLVRVLDAAGGEVLLADDDPVTGADPRFVFTAPADAYYLLEIRDNRYKPGGRYRLRLGNFPLVNAPHPLVIERGSPTNVVFPGSWSREFSPVSVAVLGGGDGQVGLSVRSPDRAASSWTVLGVTDLPVYARSLIRVPDEPLPLRLPCVATGVIDNSNEPYLFELDARKGTSLRFRAITRSLGSAAIVSLSVLDSAGKKLAQSPVTDSDEPVLSFAVAADGKYQLAVEELAGRGGPDYVYAVECRTGPQFSLLLKNDKNNRLKHALPSGGAFYLDVQCQRAGHDGPITLNAHSDRSGWHVYNTVIPAKANEVRMYVQPPVDLSAGELATLRVIGRGEAGGQSFAANMQTTVPLRLARPQVPYPPAWHDGAVFVSGMGAKPGFYTATTSSPLLKYDRQAGSAQFAIDFERTDAKFKDVPLVIVPVGLPAGVTAEVKRNGNGPKETYDLTLKGPKDLDAGEHSFRYFAYAEMGGVGRGTLSGDLRLSVTAEATKRAAEAKTP